MPLENDEGEDLQLTGSTFACQPQVVGGVYSPAAYVQALRVDPSGSVFITASGSLPVHLDAAVQATIAGQISVNNFPATQNVSGTVTSIIGNWPATHGVSASVQLPIFSTGPVGVTASAPLPVDINNWPATIAVSGSQALRIWDGGTQGVSGTVGAVVQNWPATVGVSASVPLQVWSEGPNAVSGTLQVYTSAAQGVSASAQLSFFATGPIGVSASATLPIQGVVGGVPIQIWSEGTIGVSGSFSLGGQVGVNNFPAVQAVSGNVGAVIQNWPATIGVSGSTALRVWDGGVQGVTASQQLPVFNTGPVGVSGTVAVTTSGPLQVWTEGAFGVSASVQLPVYNTGPVGVTGTVAITTTNPLQVYSSGTLGVSGTVGVNNFPAIQAVSGNVGAVIQNWPATLGISASAVLPVDVNNWPATIGISGSTAIRVWDSGISAVSGTVTVTSTGSLGVSVQNTPTVIQGQGNINASNYWVTRNTDGTNFTPTGDSPARAIYVTGSTAQRVWDGGIQGISGSVSSMITDGVNGTVAVKPASTAPTATDAALVVVLSPNQTSIPVSVAAVSGSTTGIGIGYVSTSATTQTWVAASTYNEQSTNAQRSFKSTSANDTSAGTGAQTITLTYYDQSGNGPYTETVTLNGTTAVNTVNTNICFIENIIVSTAGSGGTNAGVITMYVGTGGTGGTIGSVNAGDGRTFWAHHYVPNGKTCSVTGLSGHNTASSNGSVLVLKAKMIGVANAFESQVSDFVRCGGGTSQPVRQYTQLIKVVGPARIRCYESCEGTSTTITRCAFDFYDQ